MNKSGVGAIGGAIVGALLVGIYFAVIKPPPIPLPACGPAANCIPVWVTDVAGEKWIHTIGEFRRKGAGAIMWEIQDASYTFPSNGIEFPTTKPTHPAPPGEFPDCAPVNGSNGKRFKCNAKGNKGTYGYTVTVTGPDTVPPLDPFVVNN